MKNFHFSFFLVIVILSCGCSYRNNHIVPANEIHYTTIDNKKIELLEPNLSGIGKIKKHTYRNGKGVIKYSSNVHGIPNTYFMACNNLLSVEFSDSVSYVGASAFSGCSNLKSVSAPSLRSIDIFAFAYCESLKKFNFNDGLFYIERCAFKLCNLEEVVLPSSVKSIELGAFYGNKSLKSINVPISVKEIGDLAFAYCDSLSYVCFEDSVRLLYKMTIKPDAFLGCPCEDQIKCLYPCYYHLSDLRPHAAVPGTLDFGLAQYEIDRMIENRECQLEVSYIRTNSIPIAPKPIHPIGRGEH